MKTFNIKQHFIKSTTVLDNSFALNQNSTNTSTSFKNRRISMLIVWTNTFDEHRQFERLKMHAWKVTESMVHGFSREIPTNVWIISTSIRIRWKIWCKSYLYSLMMYRISTLYVCVYLCFSANSLSMQQKWFRVLDETPSIMF